MTTPVSFKDFDLPNSIVQAVHKLGYEQATPVQAQCIPPLLEGKDVLGKAQTGTGKTAAFALPLLSRVDLSHKNAQVLILTPTRELAQQVTQAIRDYAKDMNNCFVISLFGGSEYRTQLQQLKKGGQIIVATPGRLIDHINRGSLKLDHIKAFVLDEADEMLRMGFIDDVTWLFENMPEEIQLALFSATMPKPILSIARKHLKDPVEVSIKAEKAKTSTIRQHLVKIERNNKRQVLLRLLETLETDGVIIFTRTKRDTEELAEFLVAQRFKAVAINGDMQQEQRNRCITKLKSGTINILVATDVAARGLDIDRISHVINFDLPENSDTYVHRIGRTGRAGREGDAISLVRTREMNVRYGYERATNSKLSEMNVPDGKEIHTIRLERLSTKLNDIMSETIPEDIYAFITSFIKENDADPVKLAAALARIGKIVPKLEKEPKREAKPKSSSRRDRNKQQGGHGKKRRDMEGVEMESFRMEIGSKDGVKARNIVGAIANEAGIDGYMIQSIKIKDRYSTFLLPKGMPRKVYQTVKNTWICGKQTNLSRVRG